MAELASIASSAPDQRHLRLIAASAQANESRVRDVLSEETSWTSHNDRDALRQSLQKVAARGNLAVALLLLKYGAEVNVRSRKEGKDGADKEIPALFKAAENGSVGLVKVLLEHGADVEWRSPKTGMAALWPACQKGHVGVVRLLLDRGARVDIRDREGRTILLWLAGEKVEEKKDSKPEPTEEEVKNMTPKERAIREKGIRDALAKEKVAEEKAKARLECVRLLIGAGANMEARDAIDRTPLLWAATMGNVALMDALLSGELGKKANIHAANKKGRNALHLAAESNHEKMVELLLRRGANPNAVSDGRWTALHNACQAGHIGVVRLLLAYGANVNAQLSNEVTALHWACLNGHTQVVELLLERPETNPYLKDSFDMTPMLCAAERHHKDIVKMLSPARLANRLSDAAKAACKAFEATVVDFGSFRDGKKQLVFKHSVWELLYGWDEKEDKPTVATLPRNIKYQPAIRWIHLPANNIAWIETLLSKSFIEGGFRDIESFKALEKCFDQEHRGNLVHAHYMRTFSQRIAPAHRAASETSGGRSDSRPMRPLREEPSYATARTAPSTSTVEAPPTPRKPSASDAGDVGTPKGEGRRRGKGEAIAEQHPKRAKRNRGPPGNPPGTKAQRAIESGSMPTPLPWEQSRLALAATTGKLVLFMPYLHYETDQRRQKMSEAISEVCQRRTPPEHASRDYMLIHAYLNSTPRLHPRRTLDQFFYHGIDTSERDQDQVVYRYLKRHHAEKKVYMVDQLWMWVLGKDLVVTCFPQRWDQPKQDALNVLEGIIEETNAKTRLPVQSVFDLAMLVTSRCSGMFDRHRLDDQEYQFLDMFESSIGHVTNRESQLFFRFNRASAQSAEWLQQHRRFLRGPAVVKPRARSSSPGEDVGKLKDHEVPEELLDINVETSLLAEIKDIRDELNILAVVLENQTLILAEFEGHMIDELRSVAAQLTSASSAASDAGSTVIHQANLSSASLAAMSGMPSASTTRKTTEALISEIRRRAKEQRRLLDVHIRDIVRMDRQAESIYTSLTHLLDLKQKHSNALEARFARDHAAIAARQGQTVLVFTIVTIVFLPMSFVAAVFAINAQDWAPTAEGGGLTFNYVAKYIFGVGLAVSLPLIAMAFTVGDLAELRRRAMAGIRDWWGRIRDKRKGATEAPSRRSRSRGRRDSNANATIKAEDDASSDTAAGLHLGDEKPPAPARISAGGRISLGDEALPPRRSLGRNGSGGEGLSPILRPSGVVLDEIHGGGYDASRLGVIPQRPRGYSVTSGRSIAFSRPSFDRASRGSRGRGRGSEDLESGGGL